MNNFGIDSLDLPDNLEEIIEKPLLIIRDAVLFPQILTPLMVIRDASLAAIEAVNSGDGNLIVATQHNAELEEPMPDDVYTVGVRASIIRHLRLPDGTASVLLQGYERVELLEWHQLDPYPLVKARRIADQDEDEISLAIEAQMRAVLTMFEKCSKLHPHIPEEAYIAASNVSAPGSLADLIASTLEVSLDQRQDILETFDPMERLQRLTTILAQELDVLELEDRIQHQVQQEVDKSQREFFLREQIRVMQSELEETGGLHGDIYELRGRLDALELPEEARESAEKELKRLAEMPPMAPEIGIIRTYLDWIVDLPWSEASEDNLDVNHAEKILDKNHYGLLRVKERILEYIAVRARTVDNNKLRSPILCFVGPPGTGKTSLGKSIAEALDRKFARFSLGGIRDEAEIRGHRRTYIGSMPGRIIQTMKRVGTVNPLIMLDEIDKLGYDYRGDPTSALLEVLDPEQNFSFSDHYLDLPYDLSRVLFITTANVIDLIPYALADRMEVIEFPGYIDSEKIAIAKEYLIPRHLEEHGLSADELSFTDPAIQSIIRNYTYESGVRNLDREIGRVCRKVVRRLAQKKRATKKVTPKAAAKYLGPPQYTDFLMEEEDEVGVATGLAWTAGGGDVLSVEVSLYDGKGNLTLTGQLGEIMQESVQAALSYTKANAKKYGIDPAKFENSDIHLHVPEGATPKDGPSAGITMAVALISAFSGRKVKRHVAMTGELILRGKVLAVGGLRVKAMAAHRVGIKKIVIPQKNEKDLVEIPKRIRRHLNFILADDMDAVLDVALLAPGSS